MSSTKGWVHQIAEVIGRRVSSQNSSSTILELRGLRAQCEMRSTHANEVEISISGFNPGKTAMAPWCYESMDFLKWIFLWKQKVNENWSQTLEDQIERTFRRPKGESRARRCEGEEEEQGCIHRWHQSRVQRRTFKVSGRNKTVYDTSVPCCWTGAVMQIISKFQSLCYFVIHSLKQAKKCGVDTWIDRGTEWVNWRLFRL